MDDSKKAVLNLLQEEMEAGHIPGAVVLASLRGETILREAAGFRAIYPDRLPMEADTVFDLASLTKVTATLPAVLKLIDRGLISLDKPVAEYLPSFLEGNKGLVTIRHLLAHNSGLPADVDRRGERLTRERLMERINAAPLRSKPGERVVYSDLGMIYMAKIVELVAGEPFDQFVEREFFKPLSMSDTGFHPYPESERCASTEFDSFRNVYRSGIVHDSKADILGGVAGHAGLFSTADDLHNYALMVENDGVYQRNALLSPETVRMSKQILTPGEADQRGLGWQMKGSGDHPSCGNVFSARSYGHTGFTGTSIWFDPDIQLHVIILTNRVHYGNQHSIQPLRAKLHNLIRFFCA